MRVSEIFRSKYLKATDLQGKTVPVTIESVEVEEIGNPPEQKLVVYFQNNERGLVANLTNATLLANHFGDDTAGWIGRNVQLFCESVFFQGKQTLGLRVRVPAPRGGEVQARRSPAPATPGAEDLDDDIGF